MVWKNLNCQKLALVGKKKAGVWLAVQLGVSSVSVSKWCYYSVHHLALPRAKQEITFFIPPLLIRKKKVHPTFRVIK